MFRRSSVPSKEPSEGEDELTLAVVANSRGQGDDAEGCLRDDAEVDILAKNRGAIGGAHLASFVGSSDKDALPKRRG